MSPLFIIKVLRIFSPVLILTLLTALALSSATACADIAKKTAPATGFVPEHTKKPKYAVIGYITAYMYNDLSAVGHFDATITTAIKEQLDLTSKSKKLKAVDVEKRQIEAIRRNEREKRTNSAYAPFETQGDSAAALLPLYKVLYPGMKYRIISVRNAKPKAKATSARQYSKEVTVELRYSDIGYAPHHKGRRIKKGLIKVCLRKWNWPLEYKVCGYLPVRDGMEYIM
jgi:hypothetical protein